MSRAETLPVPYISRLEGGGFQPGQTIVIKGVAAGERFVVNLATGPGQTNDLALHMSVRQDDKHIILNSCENGQWGKEEKKKNTFKEGEKVDIRIRAHDSHFEVFADHKELMHFDHRMPLSRVNHLIVDGAIVLHSVNWGGKYYPVPYQAGVDGGFRPGKRLQVSGILEKKGKRFSVNLLAPNGDIAIHCSVRFDEKCVVRNAQHAGAWGSEEKEGKLPLEKDKVFDIVIANEDYAFQIFLNGEHFCAFAHRGDPTNMNGVRIDGDVELCGVHVK